MLALGVPPLDLLVDMTLANINADIIAFYGTNITAKLMKYDINSTSTLEPMIQSLF